MVVFRELYGTVYILENPEANRVKVGMTINRASERLREMNDLWLGRKGTCQICGARRVTLRGRVPRHLNLGSRCPGTDELPLEKDSTVAEWYLHRMKDTLGRLAGAERGSCTRRIKRLEKLLVVPRHSDHAVGSWYLCAEIFTERAEQVELLSHTFLEERLDNAAPMGEVFICSVREAIGAVELALDQLGLLETARMR